MRHRIDEIGAIGPEHREKLTSAGIETTEALLERCSDRGGRLHLARQTGLREAQLMRWVGLADLFRVEGVESESAALLEAVGVETSSALGTHEAESLAVRMHVVNEMRRLAPATPSSKTLTAWIHQARELSPRVGW